MKRIKDGSAPEALKKVGKYKDVVKNLSLSVTPHLQQKTIDNYVQSENVFKKYINGLATLDDFSTEGVLSVLDLLREKDVAKR